MARGYLMKRWIMPKLMQINWMIVFLICLLAVVGVLMQYSAAGGYMRPWALPQLLRFGMGFVMMLAIALLDIKWLMRLAYPVYFLCLLLLIIVEVAGQVGMGAQRWIGLGGLNLQPSELAKLGVILALARYFHHMRAEDMGSLRLLIPPLLMIFVPALLIFHQPNLGTAAILVMVGGGILFMAGVHWRYFAIAFTGLLAALPVGWSLLHDYQKQRVLTFLDPSQDPLGAGYNITQSIIAIGSGGMFGKGFLHGSQAQLDFLPEKQTDFIFTMLAEEAGFMGAFGVLLLFGLLLAIGLATALRCRHQFGSLVAIGVTALIFVHIFVNMAMVMGMVPVVGVPLPLLSYGGSFMLSVMLAFGLLLNVFVNRDMTLHRNTRPFF